MTWRAGAAATALLFAAAAPALADYDRGLAAYHGGDFAAALRELGKVADTDPRAQVALGIMYARGDGVAKDMAAAGDWFRRAAEAGNADGQFHYGRLRFTGTGVAQDKAAAAKLFEKAVAQRHFGAMHALSLMLEHGDGVPADPARAAALALETADGGVLRDQYRVARMYAEGRGLPPDPALAYYWMYLAARADMPEAREALPALRARLSPDEAARQEARALTWSPIFRTPDGGG